MEASNTLRRFESVLVLETLGALDTSSFLGANFRRFVLLSHLEETMNRVIVAWIVGIALITLGVIIDYIMKWGFFSQPSNT